MVHCSSVRRETLAFSEPMGLDNKDKYEFDPCGRIVDEEYRVYLALIYLLSKML